MTVLAAIDGTAASWPVLTAATAFAAATHAPVEAVYVGSGSAETPRALARRAGAEFRIIEGRPVDALSAAIDDARVDIGVIGARETPAGTAPLGPVAVRLIEAVHKPMLVVPPTGSAARPLRRVLLPLAGSDVTSLAIFESLRAILRGEVQLVVLHVFTDQTMPRMLDRPAYDLALIGREFLAAYCPDAELIELKPGPIGRCVMEASSEQEADLVVLAWDPHAPRRSSVVRDILGAAELPVLLLPVEVPA